jgi:Fe-S cluster biogenesis protein NfuA
MEHEAKVEKVLAAIEAARAYVEADGGAIAFDSLKDDVVYVHMRGPASGCASLLILHKLAVERRLLAENLGIDRMVVLPGTVLPDPVEESECGS